MVIIQKGNYYLISYGNKSGAGVGAVRVYKDGLVKSGAGSLASTENADLDKVGYYQFATNQNSTSSSNIVNNEQQNQTAHSNISAQNSQQQYSSTTEENNNSQLQVENNSLPETGEQFNSCLVTVIASVLLAVGSLLTFKKLLNQIKLRILLTNKLIIWIWFLVINSFQNKALWREFL